MRSWWLWVAWTGLWAGGCAVDRMADPVRFVEGGADAGEGSADGGADAGEGSADGGAVDAAMDGASDAGSDACTMQTFYRDGDGDGYGSAVTRACARPSGHVEQGGDCDDENRSVHPGAEERCNGVDDDCDGLTDAADSDVVDASVWYADCDGDGHVAPSAETQAFCLGDVSPTPVSLPSSCGSGGAWRMSPLSHDDCDDENPSVHPGVVSVCNGVDDNCDGLVDDESELYSGQACTDPDYASHGCAVRHWRREDGGTGAAYLFCQDERHSWWGAWGDCTRNNSGYRLVAIESAAEQRWIEDQIGGLADGWSRDWWIGARDNVGEDWAGEDKEREQSWFWMGTQQPFCRNADPDANGCDPVGGAYTNWDSPDPNRGGDCAVLSRGNGSRIRGGWYDRSCDRDYWFICESPPAGGDPFPSL